MKKIVLIAAVLLWTSSFLRGQCNESLVQKATEQVGKDAVLVRDFKVKLKEGSKKNASPAGHFSVLMQKDINYRFNILNAAEFDGKAMLQLYDKSNILGSTYNSDINQNAGSFQYKCPRTGKYQVMITFVDGKAGCAAGIMSMVLDSSMQSVKINEENTEIETLYLDMENPLRIITELARDEKLDISIDNGKIIRKDTNLFVIAEHAGEAKLTVKIINAEGKITSEMVKDFQVSPLSVPKVTLEKASDYINLSDLMSINKIRVEPWAYKILQFHLSRSRVPGSGLKSTSEFLTFEQREFLKEFRVNDRLYVVDIQVELPNGKVVTVDPLEYTIR
jgi:hypothetical protein